MAAFERLVQNTPPAKAEALFSWSQDTALNLQKSGGTVMHYARVDATFVRNKKTPGAVDQSIDFTAIAGGDDAGCRTRANLLRAALLAHFADGTYAHTAADAVAAALITAPVCTDTATCTTLLVDLQNAFDSHRTTKTPHTGIPAFNPGPTIVPVDAATNITALNELLILYQRHFYGAVEVLKLGTAG